MKFKKATMMTGTALSGLGAMTAAERAAGRFMRAPDHPPAGDPPAGDPPAGDPPANGGDPAPEPSPAPSAEGSLANQGGAPAAGDPPAGDPPADKDEGGDPPAALSEQQQAMFGAPEGDYNLQLPEGVPEGMKFDSDVFAAVAPRFKELGLSEQGAQQMVDIYAKDVLPVLAERAATQAAEQQDSQSAALRKEWADAASADPEIGGDKLQQTIDRAAQVWDAFGIKPGEGFRQLLDDSGLGNHPDMLRFLSRVGSAIGEGSFIPPGRGGDGDKTDAEVFYPEMKTGD